MVTMPDEMKEPLVATAEIDAPKSHPSVTNKGFTLRTPVIVRSPNWLGDCIMAMPAVRNLKTLLGPEPLTVAAPAKIAAIWRTCPFVDQVIPLEKPRSFIKSSAQLRQGKYGAAVLLPNSLRTALEATLSLIPQIIGYPGHARAWLLTNVVEKSAFSFQRQHLQYAYIDLISALGGSDDDTFPALTVPKLAPAADDAKPQLSLCPGAEYGPAKRWPAAYYAEVARKFINEHNAHVVLLGAAKDKECAAEITALCPGVENKVGQTSLDDFITELIRSRLVLCNDSGSMHLASALGVPTVAIFGSTEPRRTSPLGPRTDVLREHVPCSPCFLRECPLDFRCMTELPPEKVLPVCLSRWAGLTSVTLDSVKISRTYLT